MSVRELKQELEAGGVDTSGMLYKQDLTEAVETMRGERGGVAGGVDTSEEDVTCSICLEVMIEPLRLGCSHAFCRACLIQARRSAPDGGRCGICRAAITIDPETAEPDAEVAAKVAAVLSPKALREREKAAKIVMKTLLSTRVHSLPIFAMNAAVVPGQIISLHMFEPRYALMSRRVMASASKTFLYVTSSPEAGGNAHLVQLQRATPSGDGVDIRGKALEIVKLDQVWVEDGTHGLRYGKCRSPQADALAGGAEDDGGGRRRGASRRGVRNTLEVELPVFCMAGGGCRVGGTVSLNLFEPRYKTLAAIVASTHRLFLYAQSADPRPGDQAVVVRVTNCAFSPDGSARLQGIGIEQVPIASMRTDRAAGMLAFAQCQLSTASADPSMLAAAAPDYTDDERAGAGLGYEAGREGSRDVSGKRCVIM